MPPPPNSDDLNTNAKEVFSTKSVDKEKCVLFTNIKENEQSLKITSSCGEYHFDHFPRKNLKTLEANTFPYILHDVVDYLKILGCIGNYPQVKCNMDMNKTLEEQYGDNKQQTYLFDSGTLQTGPKTQSFLKFQRDRNFLQQILEEAEDEIVVKESIKNFLLRLEDYHKSENERNQLLADTKSNLEMITVLSNTLQNEKHKLTNELQEKSKELGLIKDKYEDMIYENEIKSNYVDHWETARGYQSDKVLQSKEEYLLNAIRTQKNNYQKEARINSEIEAFENYLYETYTEDTEHWMNKYSKDLDQKELETQILKEKRDTQMKELENLTKLYESRKKEMEDYLVLREQRHAEAAQLEKLNTAATKIQAWWRGVMYRKGLGPYRKRKGKKKDDTKGKGDAKGKKK